jgi:hypothetical protein
MTTESEKTSLELSKLLDELDDDYLSSLSDDDILKLRKELNPYGRTIEGSDKVLAFSYTDLQADYLKKMMLTTMVGFLNRMLDEWRVSPGIPVVTVYDYVKDPSKINDFEKTLQKPELMRADLDANKELMKKKVFIKEFLEDMFQYNPDLHVRSSYKPNTKDDERTVLSTPAAHLAISQLKSTDAEFREEMLQYDRQVLLHEKSQATSESKEETPLEENVEEKPSLPTVGPILNNVVSDVRKRTTEMIPSADIFHRFQYYYDSNFEELQHIVNDLYCCKPDFTTAVNPYAWFDNENDADIFINKHKDEVISTIFKAHSGQWNIIAPFKKVRDSMRFFNKNTQVLENIMNQIEKDSKLGQELMKKRIKIQKKNNVAKEGPDDPAFKKWRAQNTTLKDMGAVHPDDEKNNALEDEDDDADLPDDALEVPVFRVSQGGAKIERSKFYTKSEVPDIDSLPKDGDKGPSK